MALSIWPAEVALWIAHGTALLHETNGWRLGLLLGGMLFARGRLTVASWLRAGELGDDFRAYYYFLGSLGRKVKSVAGAVLCLALRVIHPGERLLFAIDDTPTKRYGPHVEGAGTLASQLRQRHISQATGRTNGRHQASRGVRGPPA